MDLLGDASPYVIMAPKRSNELLAEINDVNNRDANLFCEDCHVLSTEFEPDLLPKVQKLVGWARYPAWLGNNFEFKFPNNFLTRFT
jgi:hypothetical protein